MNPLQFFGLFITAVIVLFVVYYLACRAKEMAFNGAYSYLKAWLNKPGLPITEDIYRNMMQEYDDLEPFTDRQKELRYELLKDIYTKFAPVVKEIINQD